MIRDGQISGKPSWELPNSETIRAIIIMSAEEWADQIGGLQPFLRDYDAEEPKVRFEQIKKIAAGVMS